MITPDYNMKTSSTSGPSETSAAVQRDGFVLLREYLPHLSTLDVARSLGRILEVGNESLREKTRLPPDSAAG